MVCITGAAPVKTGKKNKVFVLSLPSNKSLQLSCVGWSTAVYLALFWLFVPQGGNIFAALSQGQSDEDQDEDAEGGDDGSDDDKPKNKNTSTVSVLSLGLQAFRVVYFMLKLDIFTFYLRPEWRKLNM